jgi:hypothetical protein
LDEDPSPTQTVQQVAQDVHALTQQMAVQQERTDAIERYLADAVAVKEGRAPKGWVQPSLDMYAKPDAPDSFIPREEKAAAPAPVEKGPAAP